MTVDMDRDQIVRAIQKYCIKPFGKDAVMEFELQPMARAIELWSYVYQVETALALAQVVVESHFGCNPAARRSRRTKNPYNVGNMDDGQDKPFNTIWEGVEAYFQLIDREYRWPADRDGRVSMRTMVANDFCRPKGGRYATAPNYTMQVFSVYNKIVADLYEPAGPAAPSSSELSVVSCESFANGKDTDRYGGNPDDAA